MRINIANPILGDDEIEQVTRVIQSGMIASGPETTKFEFEFSEFIGCKYSCAVNNGTSALSLSLSALGIGPGDEVITTPMTFVATANSILSCGAKPVFADIDPETYNLCPKSTRKAITNRTKAIMPVHLYGLPSDMEEFEGISEELGLKIIGDAAQAHGAKINGKSVGNFGDAECFSFYPTKNMTTGEGGMITTNDEELYNKMVSIRNHGRPGGELGVYEHERFGLNLRLTDIGAAIGRVQLRGLPDFNLRRKSNAIQLTKILDGIEGVTTPKVDSQFEHAWHQYTILVEDRKSLSDYLKSHGIGTGVYYPRLISEYPHLNSFDGITPVAGEVVKKVISLPVHASLAESEVNEVGKMVKKWAEEI